MIKGDLVTDGKPGGLANQILDPMFKSMIFMVWHLLSKGVTIEDFLLLKVDHNRHPVQWKVHDTT